MRSSSIQPVGSQITNATEIAGHTWNLWKGPNANWEVLSFVSATGDLTDFNVDLNDFFSKITLLRRPATVDPLMICFRISYCGTGSIGISSKSLHSLRRGISLEPQYRSFVI